MRLRTSRPEIARQSGVSLIELIAFIVIMGVSVVALLSMYRAVLPRGGSPAELTQATQLAQERMELILGERALSGYSTAVLTDPCAGGSPPSVCTSQFVPSGLYSIVVTGISPAVQWSGTSVGTYRMLGVRVLAADGRQLTELSAVIANY